MTDTNWFESARNGPPSAFTQTKAKETARIPAPPPFARHRTVFISDTHLGTPGCKAEALADFLAHNDCDTLYLVGDILDGWQLRRWYWSEAQNRVLREILRKVDAGTRVIFLPGNHDAFARGLDGRSVAGIEVKGECVHETADGRRLWVLHGDRFDDVIGYAKWLAHLGDWAYGVALGVNDSLSALRARLGLPYWSLSAWAKLQVKKAVEYISCFEETMAREAAARGVDGVVCGHIHHAEIRRIGRILYLNDGDWVESCTALVEDARGSLEILHWTSPHRCAGAQTGPVSLAGSQADRTAKAAFIPA